MFRSHHSSSHLRNNRSTERRGVDISDAAKKGDLAEIERLILKHIDDINTPDENRDFPIIIASKYGYNSIVKLLIDNGARLDCENMWSSSPIFAAVKHGHLDTVELLIESGVNIHEGVIGCDLIYLAAKCEHNDIVKYLIEQGIDINKKKSGINFVLHRSAAFMRLNVIKILVDNGADVNLIDDEGSTPLHHACTKVDIAEFLISKGVNVNIQNNQGFTALHYAAFEESVEPVLLLLDNGADPSLVNKSGRSALHFAASVGRIETMKILLNKVDIDARDKDGNTPLLNSMDTDIIELLLDNGADINATNNSGYSLLCEMVLRGRWDVVDVLLSRGASVSLVDTILESTTKLIDQRIGKVNLDRWNEMKANHT